MLPLLVAFPFFSLLVILQTAVISRLPLLHGSADVVLLVVIAWSLQERVKSAWQWSLLGGVMTGFVSAFSIYIPVIGYLAISAFARMLRRRIWKMPVLAMFVVTLLGTVFYHLLMALTLSITGTSIPWLEAFQVVTLPSLLLNLLLAVPIYALMRDMAEWLYPEDIQL